MSARGRLDEWVARFRLRFMDIGGPNDLVIVAGMGRSGTTWAADLINFDDSYRVMFEPFVSSLVGEAAGFEYIQYLSPGSEAPLLAQRAKSILAGKVRHQWVDENIQRIFYRRRIVKEIRCNLMLGWLRQIAGHPRIVLMIRHPLQVASSWRKLGWTREQLGVDCITSQEQLLRDFPIVGEVRKWIDTDDFIEVLVFHWCIVQLVPSLHLKQREAYAVFYENLVTEPAAELAGIFQYLGRPFPRDRLPQILCRPSWTNWLERDLEQQRSALVNSWRDEFSAHHKMRANAILAAFALDHIYDGSGFPSGQPFFRG